MTRINKSEFFIRVIRGFGPVLGLLLVIGIFSLLVDTPGRLLSPNNLRIVLSQTVIVAIGAIGMTLIIISGGIDLSVGSVIALTGVITALGLNAGLSPATAVAPVTPATRTSLPEMRSTPCWPAAPPGLASTETETASGDDRWRASTIHVVALPAAPLAMSQGFCKRARTTRKTGMVYLRAGKVLTPVLCAKFRRDHLPQDGGMYPR